jgi:hypothetical protein
MERHSMRVASLLAITLACALAACAKKEVPEYVAPAPSSTPSAAATPPPPVDPPRPVDPPAPVATVIASDDAGPARSALCKGAAPSCRDGDSRGFCGDVSLGTAVCEAGQWTCRQGRPVTECKYVGRAGLTRYLKENPRK